MIIDMMIIVVILEMLIEFKLLSANDNCYILIAFRPN